MMPKHRRIALNTTSLMLASLLLLPAAGSAQRYQTADGKTRVALIKMPYSGARNVPELSDSPDYLEAGGLAGRITWGDVDLKATQTVGLNDEEARQYGEWHRMGMANGHLAEMVAENEQEGFLSVGLLANCTSVLGILGGLQHSDPSGRLRKVVTAVLLYGRKDHLDPKVFLTGALINAGALLGVIVYQKRRKY